MFVPVIFPLILYVASAAFMLAQHVDVAIYVMLAAIFMKMKFQDWRD